MLHEPTWDEISIKEYPELAAPLSVDVAIIGGGMAGALSAYMLSKQGKKVALIEKEKIGTGATGVTTAFLTQSIDTDFTDIISMLGEKKAELVADSHRDAIECIERIVKEENIDCDFVRCSNYIYTDTEKDTDMLKEEHDAMKNLGIHVAFKKYSELGIPNTAYIEVYNQAKFHPLKFMKGILHAAEKEGALIFENTEAKEIFDGHRIRTPLADIRADWIISATYEPFGNPPGLFFKKGMYVSYVYEVMMPHLKLEEGTYEDTDNPYHYFRVDKEKDGVRIIVGGEDHRQDIPVNAEKNFKALAEFIDSTFPDKKYEITRQWSGPILEPIDGLAFIGPHKEDHVLYALGFSGNGMTYSMISALIFSNIIFKKEDPWLAVYRADRISSLKSLLIKGRDYFEELVRGAVKNTISHDSGKKIIK